MSIKAIGKTAAVIAAIYGSHKIGKTIGIFKGFLMGCQHSRDNQDECAQIADEWDDMLEKLGEIKITIKKA